MTRCFHLVLRIKPLLRQNLPAGVNTYIAEDTADKHREYAKITAEMQNSGRMYTYMSAVVELAIEMGIHVCDCYSKWKKLAETENTTMLLANRINHPIPEMHTLFADELYKQIIE